MRRRTAFGLTAIFATLVLAACGPAHVTVTVKLDDEGGEGPTLLDAVVVRLLPYDRDFIFDSLTAAADTPEPEIPPDLVAAQEEIADAQQAWRDAEDRWNFLRDTLNKLNEELAELNRGMTRYETIYDEWERWNREYQQVDRRKASLFQRFDSLQQETNEKMDAVRIIRQDWADQAFEDVGVVIDARFEETGLEEHADTTGVDGQGMFEVPPGDYWVYARHKLPNHEFYWNVRVTAVRSEPNLVELTPGNAEKRPIF